MIKSLLTITTMSLCLLVITSNAEEKGSSRKSGDPSIKPRLGPWKKLAVHETFDGPGLPDGTKKTIGSWTVEAGKLKGAEKPADKHKAIFTFGPKTGNAAIEIRYQCVGAGSFFELGYNRADGTGHMLRVRAGPKMLTIFKEKPKGDKQARGGLVSKDPVKAKNGQWHTLFVEIRGKQVVAHFDGKTVTAGSHPGLSNRKAPYRFVVGGDHVLFDEVKIWTAGK